MVFKETLFTGGIDSAAAILSNSFVEIKSCRSEDSGAWIDTDKAQAMAVVGNRIAFWKARSGPTAHQALVLMVKRYCTASKQAA